MEQFIELNRIFYQLSAPFGHAAKSDNIDLEEAVDSRMGRSINWDELVKEYRVVILAEAGAGKTQEIRHTTKALKRDGKNAFFIRLEHICDGLESAFEIGTYQGFTSWLNSNEEGWLFLDSVDEARLRDPRDFQKAIRKIASQISDALLRVHIVITSRVTAWRPKTDLQLCDEQFPITSLHEKTSTEELHLDEAPITPTDKKAGFKIYSLADLTREQIISFISSKGIEDSSKFLQEIESQDGWAFTTRPQDLEELIEFWNDNYRIGTRFELMQHSVARRLKERDQDRAESMPLALEKAQKGVRLLAAACAVMNESIIRIPDGTNNSKGIDIKSILIGWDDKACQILLNLPIFDEAIYGSVRFHHRSVREYLAAEWFSEELKNEGSRQKIESLFFRNQYGLQVVLPSFKPILSWLVLFDSKVMYKVYELEPEIILQGGDPSKLPLEIRREILISVCHKISLGLSDRSIENYASIARFALPDMADIIVDLIEKYKSNKSTTDYLLNLIWHGRIKQALPIAKNFVLNPQTEKYIRITALKVVKEIGIQRDLNAVIDVFIHESEPHDRSFFAELINSLETGSESVRYILKGLDNTQPKKRYDHDPLGYALVNFIERLDCDAASELVIGIDKFLRSEPVIEPNHCEISQQYGWLLPISAKAIETLILNKDSAIFSPESLFVLIELPAFTEYGDFDDFPLNSDISEQIAQWKELNHALFWKTIEETRKKHERPLTNFWEVWGRRAYWHFEKSDFDSITTDISSRLLLDDRLVALSLAFRIYQDNGCLKEWFNSIEKAVANDENLKTRFNEFLQPPIHPDELKRLKKEDAQRKRKNKEREKKRLKEHVDNVKWLNKNYQELRFNGLEKGCISNPQYFMFERMHSSKGSFSLTVGNWQSLIKDYGKEVAEAFRDGLVGFWRTYIPTFLSESGEIDNKIPDAISFGLSGLEIESTETPNWPQALSLEDAKTACRYVFQELNSFPDWFPKLYKEFPDIIHQLVIHEIKWELKVGTPNTSRLYILSKVSYQCDWLWDGIAPALFQALEKEPGNANDLGEALGIIERSSTVSDNDLAAFAERKCNAIIPWPNTSHWYATWIGIDPEPAIQSFKSYLATLFVQNRDDAKDLAMMTIVNLMGNRRSKSILKESIKTPQHLKELYTLMHQYIRVNEDIERANTGVYSPGLRDDAQEARNNLFTILKNIPGKESYLAIVELSKMHPVESYRNWMIKSAKERAEIDADNSNWTVERFVEYARTLESRPTNHRELFDLGVQRLLDLKHDLEEDDGSFSSTLAKENEETGIRKFIAKWCNDRAKDRYFLTQEEELADAKRPDCRFVSSLFDAPVPLELKLADNWKSSAFFERLENQLCRDYLRDCKSNRGIYVLVYRGKRTRWELPDGNHNATFDELIIALQEHWNNLSSKYPKVEQIAVIGIDLTKRMNRVKASKKK
ncbi:hypothetical protein GCM10028808_73980 [Spirosoma migulaei]